MYRDFSNESKNKLLGLVSDVENEKWCDFTDWVGDRWLDFESWIGTLSIKRYVNNVNSYHKKVIDKNNATKKSIEKIFNSVSAIDKTYQGTFNNIEELLKQWKTYVNELSVITDPSNGNFTTQFMSDKLSNILKGIDKQNIECLRDRMVQDIDGELVFNEELLYEYVKKNPAEMSDAEQALLLEVISQLKDTVAIYETLATVGTDKLGMDVINYVSWLSDCTKYESFSAVSAHYNDIYVNLLNYMEEQSEDANTFAASLLTAGIGSGALSIIGVETYENLKDIFGSDSFKAYVAKYKSEHTEQYFLKLEKSEQLGLESGGKFKNINDAIKEKLEDKGKYEEEEITEYYDKDGNKIDEKDAPSFYKRQMTLGEIKKSASASVSIYDGTFEIGDSGEVGVTVGEAEAHASISGGFYVVGANGEKKFSPGVKAEVGASVTALEVDWEQQWLGDENFGLNSDVSVTVGKAEAQAEAQAQIFGEDGKLDLQLNAGASAELIGGEIEGSVGVNVLGGEVGVSGSINYGVGAHAEVGYKDGVFKCDIGASLGVGVSVGFEVDVGGMVDTVADTASAAWDGIKSGWNNFWSGW